MKKWLKRIRGAVGIGLTWAAAWIGVLTIAVSVVEFRIGYAWPPSLVHLLANSALFGAMGFIGGAAFSEVLGIAEGRRKFDEMSLRRFANWGAVGGLLLYVFMALTSNGLNLGGLLTTGVFCALMGAGSASGSLALARQIQGDTTTVTERVRRMIDEALEAATGSLQEIADDAGVSHDTLWAWKTGRRNPSPENLARLADAIDRRGGVLQTLAEDHRKAAEELEGRGPVIESSGPLAPRLRGRRSDRRLDPAGVRD